MVASRRWIAVVVAVALAAGTGGCAEGVPGAGPAGDDGVDAGDGPGERPDAGERADAGEDGPAPDAGVPDAGAPDAAAARTVTLSQNVSEAVTGGAVACIGGGGLFTPRYLRENSWYRVFVLPEHGVDGTLDVTETIDVRGCAMPVCGPIAFFRYCTFMPFGIQRMSSGIDASVITPAHNSARLHKAMACTLPMWFCMLRRCGMRASQRPGSSATMVGWMLPK